MRRETGLLMAAGLVVTAAGFLIPKGLTTASTSISGEDGVPSAFRVSATSTLENSPASKPVDRQREGKCEAYLPEDNAMPPRESTRGEADRIITRFLDRYVPNDRADQGAQDQKTANQNATTSVAPVTAQGETFPEGTRFAIALVPDPVHTNLSLIFDRQIDMMQAAARDAGYDWDAQWLPWQKPESSQDTYLRDRQMEEDIRLRREACPGVLLFRKHLTVADAVPPKPPDPPKDVSQKPAGTTQSTSNTPDAAYRHPLVVFLVGERPTDGINLHQWRNALMQISIMRTLPQLPPDDKSTHPKSPLPPRGKPAQPQDPPPPIPLLRILGPTFSGSFPSLQRQMSLANLKQWLGAPPSQVLMLSGSVSSKDSIRNFRVAVESSNGSTPQIQFGTFSESDELQIERLLAYLQMAHKAPCGKVAIISEDETAYARPITKEVCPKDDKDPHPELLSLSYPRDISNLREAYEKQSIFESFFPHDRPLRAILHNDSSAQDEGKGDAVPTFSGGGSAVDKEAYLFGVVEQLRTHQIQYIVLRSTNPLDYLFLSRFFHRTYPEAHMVMVGADSLFPREVDSNDFRGDMALSSYPLMVQPSHWSTYDDRGHIVFPGRMAAGTYMASRFLFRLEDAAGVKKDDGCKRDLKDPPCPLVLSESNIGITKDDGTTEPKLPAYSMPIWALPADADNHDHPADPKSPTQSKDTDSQAQPTGPRDHVPPTWLVAVGRDGYWPIRALTGGDSPSVQSPITLNGVKSPGYYYEVPRLMKVALCFAILLVLYQIWGLYSVCPSTSAAMSFVFHNNYRLRGQAMLRGISSALALFPLYELSWPRISLLLTPGFGSGHRLELIVYIGVDLVLTTVVGLFLVQFNQTEEPLAKDGDLLKFRFSIKRRTITRMRSGLWFLILVGLALGVFFIYVGLLHQSGPTFPLVYRMEHPGSGLSALLPILFLTGGCYVWIWQLMAANLMLGPGRPDLPFGTDSFGEIPDTQPGSAEAQQDSAKVQQDAAKESKRPFLAAIWAWQYGSPVTSPKLSILLAWFANLKPLKFVWSLGKSIYLFARWPRVATLEDRKRFSTQTVPDETKKQRKIRRKKERKIKREEERRIRRRSFPELWQDEAIKLRYSGPWTRFFPSVLRAFSEFGAQEFRWEFIEPLRAEGEVRDKSGLFTWLWKLWEFLIWSCKPLRWLGQRLLWRVGLREEQPQRETAERTAEDPARYVILKPTLKKRLPVNMRRLSRKIAVKINQVANPFYIFNEAILSIAAICTLWFVWGLMPDAGALTLEGHRFNLCLFIAVSLMGLVLLVNAYRLYATWGQLKRVLLALNRTRIREVFARVKPLSTVSLWTASTNVHRVQFRIFYQQFDALRRLLNRDPGAGENQLHLEDANDPEKILSLAYRRGNFVVDRTRSELEKGMAAYWWILFVKEDGEELDRTIRDTFRDATAHLIRCCLPFWQNNEESLYAKKLPENPRVPHIEAAEEFICGQYMAFIHIVVARMRTMTVSMAALFVCISFVFVSYPFVPHDYIRSLLLGLFVLIAVVVGYIYLGMDRDEILSLMTQTRPGRVGTEFWLKYAGFLAGPVLAIFAAQYPSLVDIALRWLQPGLSLSR